MTKVKRIKTEAYRERNEHEDCLSVCGYRSLLVSINSWKYLLFTEIYELL